MNVQKSRGYSWENEVTKNYNNSKYNGVKMNAKRLGERGQPDVLVVCKHMVVVVECKSTIRDNIYIYPKQLTILNGWSLLFTPQAQIHVAAKFMANKKHKLDKWYFQLNDLDINKTVKIRRDGIINIPATYL